MRHLLFLAAFFALTNVLGQFTGLPVTLSQPYDREVLEDNEPLLVWQTDLSTIVDNPRVSMRLTLSEILMDQSPSEAIQVNAPILLREELKSSTWSYSSTDTELKPGHHYAWQVAIYYNGVVVQQSEVWEFSIKSPVPPLSAFHPLKWKQDGAVYSLLDDRLNVSVQSLAPLSTDIVIIGPDGREYRKKLQELLEGKFTDESVSAPQSSTRYFSVDLKELKKGIYTLRWSSAGKDYQLKFRR